MAYIVNLSTLQSPIPQHRLGLINIPQDGLDAFAELSKEFSTHSCCPSIFNSLSDYSWVMYQFSIQVPRLINPYKLGQKTTMKFLEELHTIFNFIDENSLTLHRNIPKTNKIKENKNKYFCLKDKAFLKENDYAYALLEDAWNAIIKITQQDASKFRTLVDKSEQEAVYLVSNTNELNVHAILSQLQEHLPDLKLDPKLIELNDQSLIQLIPDREIYLYPSYLARQFKAEYASTPSLMERLKNSQLLKPSETFVVSQYQGDLDWAKNKLQINPEQCLSPDKFYGPQPQVNEPKPSSKKEKLN